MADTISSGPKGIETLSEKELKHLAGAWLASTSGNLDIELFSRIVHYPCTTNARKRLNEVKNSAKAKIFGDGSAASSAAIATPLQTPKKVAKRKGNPHEAVDSPPKKRGRPRKAAAPVTTLPTPSNDDPCSPVVMSKHTDTIRKEVGGSGKVVKKEEPAVSSRVVAMTEADAHGLI